MASGIEVNQTVFELLKKSYSKNFGSSPKSLIERLNSYFKEYIHQNQERTTDLISDKTIRNFFKDPKPPKTQIKNLNYLCKVLLDVSSYDEALKEYASNSHLDEKDFIQKYSEYLKENCGSIQVLDMTESMDLKESCVQVKLTKKIRRQRTYEEILEILNYIESNSDTLVETSEQQETVNGLDAVKEYPKLMLLGLPGSGKTTFCKNVALHYLEDKSEGELIPIYLELKKIIEEDEKGSNSSIIISAVIKEFTTSISNSEKILQAFLEQGRCLILLDGLDEVRKADSHLVINSINNLVKHYPKNRYILTCRIAANDYVFPNFKIVEIASFGREQVDFFVKNWFKNDRLHDRATFFLKNLRANPSLEELSKTPLLLTMLCIVFEKGYDIYKNRFELYEEAINIFLEKWDASRMVKRDPIVSEEETGSEHSSRHEEIYREKLTKRRKINLLANIAYNAFTQENQKRLWRRWELEQEIRTFIQNFSGIKTENLDIDSQDILKSIESNCGLIVEKGINIYAFSHLSFQEYFTAQYIVENYNEELLKTIVENHLVNQEWREVFLIIAGRLPKIDLLLKLMLERARLLVKSDDLQELLNWLNRITAWSGVQSSAWRAYFLSVGLTIDLYLAHNNKIQSEFAEQLAVNLKKLNQQRENKILRTRRCELILYLAIIITVAFDLATNSEILIEKTHQDFKYHLDIHEKIDIADKLNNCITIAEELNMTELKDKLVNLSESLPVNTDVNYRCMLKEWVKAVQDILIRDLDIGYRKTLSKEDCKNLENYFYVNHLIVECCRGDTYSSRDLRERAIDNLLLIDENI